MNSNEIATYIIASVLSQSDIPPVDINEVFCLTEAIYHEARGEPIRGQFAVALVVKNRVQSSSYPDTYCEVIKQPYQFSYNNDGSVYTYIDSLEVPDANALQWSTMIAVDVINGKMRDFTKGSLHYFAHDLVTPRWGKYGEVSLVVNGHTFVNNMRNR